LARRPRVEAVLADPRDFVVAGAPAVATFATRFVTRCATTGSGASALSTARFAADFAAARLLLRDFLAAMGLVYGLGIRREAGIIETGTFHHRAQVVESDASIDLDHRPLDHLFELRGVERPGTGERQKMPPRLRGEAATLVRSKYAYHQ
jgi:hypothetical protein